MPRSAFHNYSCVVVVVVVVVVEVPSPRLDLVAAYYALNRLVEPRIDVIWAAGTAT